MNILLTSGVARICCEEGQDENYVMRHWRRTSGSSEAAARWLIVLWLMQHWSKELWVVDICISQSRSLHNTWIVGSQMWSKVNQKWNCWKSRGHVPQSPIAGDATARCNVYIILSIVKHISQCIPTNRLVLSTEQIHTLVASCIQKCPQNNCKK